METPHKEGCNSRVFFMPKDFLVSRFSPDCFVPIDILMPVRRAITRKCLKWLCPTHDYLSQKPATCPSSLQTHSTVRFMCPTRTTLLYYSLNLMGQFVNNTWGGFQQRVYLNPICLLYSFLCILVSFQILPLGLFCVQNCLN